MYLRAYLGSDGNRVLEQSAMCWTSRLRELLVQYAVFSREYRPSQKISAA